MTVVPQLVKKFLDKLIRATGALLPEWKDEQGKVVAPAIPPYALPTPRNANQVEPAHLVRFSRMYSWPERKIYLLRAVHVSWHGVVFHNLRLFRPSIIPLQMQAEFEGTFLLRQWWRGGGQVVTADEAVSLAHGPWGAGNYYHWMIDTLPRLLLLQRHHPSCMLLVPDTGAAYMRQTAAMFGFEHLLPLRYGQVAKVAQLALPDYTAALGAQDPELIRLVRSTILRAVPGVAEMLVNGRRIYASRNRQPIRNLLNEDEIEPLLKLYNFETVFFETLSFEEQVRLLHQTTVLVGVHGANLTNMLFMAQRGIVVELINEAVDNPCYYRLASDLGLAYYYVPCHSAALESGNNMNDVDIHVDPAILHDTLQGVFDITY